MKVQIRPWLSSTLIFLPQFDQIQYITTLLDLWVRHSKSSVGKINCELWRKANVMNEKFKL